MASAPPKARPRPRPRIKVASTASIPSDGAAQAKSEKGAVTGAGAKESAVINIDDDDDGDILNHFRHARAVAEQGAMRKSTEPPSPPSDHAPADYSDEEDGSTTRKRRTGSQGGSPSKKKLLKMPAWTLADNGADKPGESSKPRAPSVKPSRSKSRTPAPVPVDVSDVHEVSSGSEPEIQIMPSKQPAHKQVAAAATIASQSLGLLSGQAALRQQQDALINPYIDPPLHDEPEDEDSLLDAARDAEIQALLAGRKMSASVAADETEETPVMDVTVTMQWHVEEVEGATMSKKAKEVLTKKRSVRMTTSQPIEVVYDFVLETLRRPKDQVVLAYNGTKIYGSQQTLQQLKITKDCQIDGYTSAGWAEVQQREEDERRKALEAAAREDADDDSKEAAGSNGAAEADEEEAAETFSLTLRGVTGSVNVKVKPTTKLSSLVQHYARKMSVETAASLRLEWDGDHPDLAGTVADLDAEDGDMVTVEGG